MSRFWSVAAQRVFDAVTRRRCAVWLSFPALGIALLTILSSAGCSSRTINSTSANTAFVTVPQSGISEWRIDNSGNFTNVLGSPFQVGNSPISLQLHPSNQFLYVANQADSTISLLKIDSNSGALTEVLPRTSTPAEPSLLLMNKGGTLLFSMNIAGGNVAVFSINASNGALTQVPGSPFTTGANPSGMAITPTADFLYVSNANQSLIYAYSVSSAGALQQVSGSPFPVTTYPLGMAVNPAGTLLFVANSGANTVSVFAIGSTGGLTPAPLSPFTVGTSPVAVAVAPTGDFVYVVNQGSNNLSMFSVATNGVLTAVSGSPFSTGSGPSYVVADPNGTFVYIGNQRSATITVYQFEPISSSNTEITLTGTGNTPSTTLASSSMAVTN